MIGNRFHNRLPSRFATSECMEANLSSCEVNVCSDQAVRPRAVHNKRVPEQADTTMGIGSAQVDNAAFGASLEIKLPRARKQASLWGRFNAQSSTLTVGGDI